MPLNWQPPPNAGQGRPPAQHPPGPGQPVPGVTPVHAPPQGQMPNVDLPSLIVSYLFGAHGQALLIELSMALQRSQQDVLQAVHHLYETGYVDRDLGELPSVRFTREAVEAIMAHTNTGAPLPERLVRAADREAAVRATAAQAQARMATVLEQVLEEQRATRQELQRLRQLPGAQPGPQRLPYQGPQQ